MSSKNSRRDYDTFLNHCKRQGFVLQRDRIIDHFWSGWFVHYEMSRLVDVLRWRMETL